MLLIRTYVIISDLSLTAESAFNGFGRSIEVSDDSCDTFECEICPINPFKVRPLFTLSHRGSDNSPLLIVFSANNIDQSIVTLMRLKEGYTISLSSKILHCV